MWVSSHENHLRKYSCSGYLVPRSSRNHWRSSIFWHISQLQSNYSNIDRLLGECKKLFTNQAKCITAGYLTIMCCSYLHYSLWRMSDTWPSIKMSFYDEFSVRNAGWRISWQFLVAIWYVDSYISESYLLESQHVSSHRWRRLLMERRRTTSQTSSTSTVCVGVVIKIPIWILVKRWKLFGIFIVPIIHNMLSCPEASNHL